MSRFSAVERQVGEIQAQIAVLDERVATLTALMEGFHEAAEAERRAECRRRQVEESGSYSGC